ncbi:MAG: methylphosphotriester-DNA--protein-cysteine methyltransferase family protein [Rhodopseudomonas sp.]|uniref:bifunctional transcriptional activator/DNA repair enzyme AdaA n=1 Tax=Rhodopseudomonas sp. TaxID=1078 RepID=UPI001855061D|nr:Ada metal-binding domain-containing protein [Rhodopseudomonas sp.]NVN88640.1 methylphosphotriester-DNA--protein-cysteine methyltransferase family protein [Rhodopseudomonas sp.]
MLDFNTCDRARRQRDRALDGVFFTAVATTGIYCRPICPAQPLSCNVSFYSSAAAAERDGFRPCLRCRPETAPFSPAWNGTRTTVGRALRLIQAGALDRGPVGGLADKLGIGERHLCRLFQAYLGSSPMAVARTCRVQRAKRLLDSTDLPMTEIAARSGFASTRSFNATFVDVYGQSPTSIRTRRRARTIGRHASDGSTRR